MRRSILAALAAGALLMVNASCGGNSAGLVGRWRVVNAAGDVSEIHLNADGSAGFLSSLGGCTGEVSLQGFTWSADATTIRISPAAPRCSGMVVCPDPNRNLSCGFGGPDAPQPYTLSSDRNTLTLSGVTYTRVP